MSSKFTKHDEKLLANFLRNNRKKSAMSLLQTQGFLFSVACCPELIQPSEWIPLILGDATFKDEQETERVMQALMGLYNHVNNQVLHGTVKLPKDCRMLPDTMSNFVDPAPIHQWAQGFMTGHTWLSECWEGIFDTDEEVKFGFSFNVMALGLAADEQAMRNAFEDQMDEDELMNMAKGMLELMPNALKSFAKLALALREESLDSPTSHYLH